MSFSSPPNNEFSSPPPNIHTNVHQGPGGPENVFDQYDNYNALETTTSPASSSGKHSGLSFFKNFAPGKTTKDGQPAKRRGPKPDAKPAQTRRQELNRQAQRTHRERKEAYLRTLETEVMRLREAFTIVTREKSNLADENRLMKEHMRSLGISWPPVPGQLPAALPIAPVAPPPPPKDEDMNKLLHGDFDSLGVDFVLALERPCMEHIQTLAINANADPTGTEINGHALMASCPPESHILNNPNEPWGLKTYPLQPAELNTLLNMSQSANLNGELTPISAWSLIQNHPRFFELTREDFSILKAELVPKIRCYGFGAVIEEFMVKDALSAVFAAKFAQQHQAYY